MDKRMMELNRKLNEASYKTQADYFDAKDMRRAVDAAMDIIQTQLHNIEVETSESLDIPGYIDVLGIINKQLNLPKVGKEIEKQYKKGTK